MSEASCKQLIFELVEELRANNFNISKANIGNIEFINSSDTCGYTLFMTEKTYKLGINIKLLKEGKLDYLKSVICHELAHIIQYNEAVLKNIIRYNQAENYIDILCEDVSEADSLIFDNFHHTPFWQSIADKINLLFNLTPKITAYLKTADLNKFLEGFFMDDRKRRNDPVIDYTISGLTLDDMMKYDLKPEYRTNEKEVLKALNKKYQAKEPSTKKEET